MVLKFEEDRGEYFKLKKLIENITHLEIDIYKLKEKIDSLEYTEEVSVKIYVDITGESFSLPSSSLRYILIDERNKLEEKLNRLFKEVDLMQRFIDEAYINYLDE